MSIASAPRPGATARYETFVETQIGRARRRIRSLDLSAAFLGLAAGTLGYGLAVALVDRWLILPAGVRQAAFAVYLVAAAAYTGFVVLRPLVRPVNPYYAAVQVEHALPGAKNSLVNWLDLRDEPLPPPVRGALTRHAAKDLARADFDQAISARRAGWLGAAAGGLFVALLILFLQGPAQFRSLMGRAFAPFSGSQLATRTQITVTQPDGGDTTVAIGRAVSLAVHVDGRVPPTEGPDAVRLLYRHHAGEPFEERPFAAGETRRDFVLTVPASEVQNGFLYKVAGGDAETPEYQVRVRSTPLVTDTEVRLHYRPYLRRPDETTHEPNIEVLRGTDVILIARTNREIREGHIDLDAVGGGPRTVAAEPVPGEPQAMRFDLNRDVLSAAIGAADQTAYRVWFTSAEGEHNTDPVPYTIKLLPDNPPTVELTQPGQDVLLPVNGILRLEGSADDDYGLTALALKLTVGDGTLSFPYRAGKSFRLPDGGDPTHLDYKDFVDLAKVTQKNGHPLQPGMTLVYQLEAADNCDYPPPLPHTGLSKLYRVRLSDPQEPRQQQQDRKQAAEDQKRHDQQQDQQLGNKPDGGKGGDSKPDPGQHKGDADQKPQPDQTKGGQQDPDDKLRQQAEKLQQALRDRDKDQKSGDRQQGDSKQQGEKNTGDSNNGQGNQGDQNQSKEDGQGGSSQQRDQQDGNGQGEQQQKGGSQEGQSQGKDQSGQSGAKSDGGAKQGTEPNAGAGQGGQPKSPDGEKSGQPQSGDQQGEPQRKPGAQGARQDKGESGDKAEQKQNGAGDGESREKSDAKSGGQGDSTKPENGDRSGNKTDAGSQSGGNQDEKQGSQSGKSHAGQGSHQQKGDQAGKPESGQDQRSNKGEQGAQASKPGTDQAEKRGGQAGDKKSQGADQKQSGGSQQQSAEGQGDKPQPGDQKQGGDSAGKANSGKSGDAERQPGGADKQSGDKQGAGQSGDSQQGKPSGTAGGQDKGQRPGAGAKGATGEGQQSGSKGEQSKAGDRARGQSEGEQGAQRERLADKSPEQIEKLIKDLDSGDAQVRRAAADKLKDAEQIKDPKLRDAVQKALAKSGEAGQKSQGEGESQQGGRGREEKSGAGRDGAQAGRKPTQSDASARQTQGQPGDKPGQPTGQKAGDGANPAAAKSGNGTGKQQPTPPDAQVQRQRDGRPPDQGQPGSGVAGGGARQGEAGSAGEAPEGSAADPRYARRAGVLQLEDLKKVTPKLAKKAGLSEKELEEFLRKYPDYFKRQNDVGPDKLTNPKAAGGPLANRGVRQVTPRDDIRDFGPQHGTPGSAPAEYRDIYREFSKKLSDMDRAPPRK